jgi:hypothetical protein
MSAAPLPSQLAADLLARGHSVRLRVEGGSMRPAILPGVTVTLHPVSSTTTLRLGMVVLAVCGGRPMLHRIVRLLPQVRTKGDALGALDPPPAAILGILDKSGSSQDQRRARRSLARLPWQSLGMRLRAVLRRPSSPITPLAVLWEVETRRNQPRTLARTVWLQSYLAEFLKACVAQSLPVLVLKGAVLAETAYPELGLRDFRDLDILVRMADAPRARAILETLGYAGDPWHGDDLCAGRDGQMDFARATPAGPVVLELHVDWFNNDLLPEQVVWDEDGIWGRARPVTVAGTAACALGQEDQLLHLCLHWAGHHGQALRSLRDIAGVCESGPTDWTRLCALAQQARMRRIAWVGLSLAARLFAAAVPREVLAALAPPFPHLLQHLALCRTQDLPGHRTAWLRLPLWAMTCDRPPNLGRIVRRLWRSHPRRQHDRQAASEAP